MMRKGAWRWAILVAMIAPLEAPAQPPGTWKNFTAMENVRSGTVFNGRFWAAGPGGMFVFVDTTIIATYTTAEGISTNDVTVILPIGNAMWVGASTGAVDIVGSTGVQHITDILESPRIQKGIRTFFASGDTVFIGTDFGVSIYRRSRSEFGDTYANLGFSIQARVNRVVVVDDELWLATDQGVARANRFGVNLSAPSSWQRYQTGAGLPSNAVKALVVVNDTVVAGTAAGAAFFDGSGFQKLATVDSAQIADLLARDGEWFALFNSGGTHSIQRIPGVTGAAQAMGTNSSGTANAFVDSLRNGIPRIATTFRGIASWSGTAWEYVMPNGPQSNLFTSLAIDEHGVLWSASGISGQGKGFYRYDPSLPEGKRWKNFTVAKYPMMASNDYFDIDMGPNGTVWVSSWGSGAVQVAGDSVVRRIDTQSVPNFSTSAPINPNYAVVNGAAVDRNGLTWFSNWGATNRNFVACLTSDTTFAYYTSGLIGQGLFTAIAIDLNGTKWFANTEPFHPAKGQYLYYFNEEGIVSGTSASGGWGFMTESDGLPKNTVLSVAVDLTGSVVVGTELGLMIISDPLYPKQRRFSSFPLREQSIQAIAVDAVNNKWVGTREGVFVMNADATQILQQYTVANTGGRLVDNDIRGLAIDQKRGIAYFGTERGLSSVFIAPVQTERSLTSLDIGPNPYTLPSSGMMTIRNLIAESSIKVLRVDGSLVKEFRAQGGGRAFWDGKDATGEFVGSGVYFIVAYSEDGEELAVGKVAVVRR